MASNLLCLGQSPSQLSLPSLRTHTNLPLEPPRNASWPPERNDRVEGFAPLGLVCRHGDLRRRAIHLRLQSPARETKVVRGKAKTPTVIDSRYYSSFRKKLLTKSNDTPNSNVRSCRQTSSHVRNGSQMDAWNRTLGFGSTMENHEISSIFLSRHLQAT